jgi:pectinesterase inhibitor-like protein
MVPSTYLSLLLTISMIFISQAISPTPSPKLYENVCQSVQEERCLKLLESNPQITSAIDYVTLSRLFLEMAIDKATKGQDYLKSLINKYPSSQILKKCATNNYDYLILGFRLAIPQLTKDPNGANWDATSAYHGPDMCEQNLAQEKIVKEPSITKLNNDMQFLCDIAGVAIDFIRQ